MAKILALSDMEMEMAIQAVLRLTVEKKELKHDDWFQYQKLLDKLQKAITVK